MKEKLMNNLGLKVLSIFLAFFVWLAVVNVTNPEVSRTREVPLEVVNADVLESKNLTYDISAGKTVTVAYKVHTMDDGIVKASDFRAYIDLAEIYEPTGSVQVHVEVLNHTDLLTSTPTARPEVIKVNTESLQSKRFDLKVTTVGTAADGYVAGTATVTPSYVYVSGPVSRVGRISDVGIEINIDNANANLIGTATPIFYDANGNKLSADDRLSLNRSSVSYELAILRSRELALDFSQVSGTVADGYRFTGVESSVKSVKVQGLVTDMANLSAITVSAEDLKIDGADADKVVTLDLSKYLPDGVQIVDGNSTITVTLKVEPLVERAYTLHTGQIELEGTRDAYDYTVSPTSINVIVRGLKEDLDLLTSDKFNAKMNVAQMELGEHTGVITFNDIDQSQAYEIVSYDQPTVTVSVHGPGVSSESASESDTKSEEAETTAPE